MLTPIKALKIFSKIKTRDKKRIYILKKYIKKLATMNNLGIIRDI